jgi:hypothetical protein
MPKDHNIEHVLMNYIAVYLFNLAFMAWSLVKHRDNFTFTFSILEKGIRFDVNKNGNTIC